MGVQIAALRGFQESRYPLHISTILRALRRGQRRRCKGHVRASTCSTASGERRSRFHPLRIRLRCGSMRRCMSGVWMGITSLTISWKAKHRPGASTWYGGTWMGRATSWSPSYPLLCTRWSRTALCSSLQTHPYSNCCANRSLAPHGWCPKAFPSSGCERSRQRISKTSTPELKS